MERDLQAQLVNENAGDREAGTELVKGGVRSAQIMDGGLQAQAVIENVEVYEAGFEAESSASPESNDAISTSMPILGRTPARTVGSGTPPSLENGNTDPSPESLTATSPDDEDTATTLPSVSAIKPYQCQKCLKPFSHSQAAAACRKNSATSSIECPVCKEQYSSAEVLDHHMMAEHPMGPTSHSCSVCHKRFLLEKYLTAHTRACHSKEEDRASRCSLCGEGFVGPAGLASHLGAGKCGWTEGGMLGYRAAD